LPKLKQLKLCSLSASNFKSFGNEVIEFSISDDLNIIAGRNGSGKSNLMAIYLVIREVLEEKGIDLSYYHDGNTSEELRIGMRALLDGEDVRELMASLNLSANFKNDFLDLFGTDLKIDIITIPALQQVKIKIGKMWIYDGNFGSWYEKKMNADSTVETALSTLVEKAIKEKISLVQRVTRFFEENKGVSDESPNRLIRLGNNIQVAIKQIFDKSIVYFPEFRQRSEKGGGHITHNSKVSVIHT
jgi:predicted ATPase